MNNDLKIIKKKYGENMSHLCRKLFPTLLEIEGYLPKLLLENFYPTRFLYEDLQSQNMINPFRDYIFNLAKHKSMQEQKLDTGKMPEELMSEVGYDLVECITPEDLQQFEKYFQSKEKICTFKEARLTGCRVFFATKKNVDQIKRENFKNPQRQDEYGTSVISIQFTKDASHSLFITNRYNHEVDNCDATFGNDLENVIPGLTQSFKKKYGLIENYSQQLYLRQYKRANDGKYYRYNYAIKDIYYCPDNIIIDHGVVKQLDREAYIVLDYFILDRKNKEIVLYDKSIEDTFPGSIKEIEKIEVTKNEDTKEIVIISKEKEPILITLNSKGCIISIENNNMEKAEDNFLQRVEHIEEFTALNLKQVGDDFLKLARKLQKLNTPNLEEAGSYFLTENEEVTEIILEKLRKVGNHFFEKDKKVKKLMISNIEEMGSMCMCAVQEITELYLLKLRKVGTGFMTYNKTLIKFIAPSLEEAGSFFLYTNTILQEFFAPMLKKMGDYSFNFHPVFKKRFAEEMKEGKTL